MKLKLQLNFLIFLLSSCGQRDVLVDNQWILIGGIFNDKRIEFNSNNIIVFNDSQGKEIHSLNFNEDRTIILPGINSSSISGAGK